MTDAWNGNVRAEPTVELKVWTTDGRMPRRVEVGGPGERKVRKSGPLVVPVYRTRGGSSTKIVAAPLNCLKDAGPIYVHGHELRVDGRLVVEHDQPYTLSPGRALPITVYLGAAGFGELVRETYWDHRCPTQPHPSWAPDKLAHGPGFKQIGPFEVCGNKAGNQGGGQFTELPTFMDWRMFPAGWEYTYRAMERWLQRSPIVMADEEANPIWFSDPGYTLKHGTGPATGYEYDPFADQHWRGARELGAFSPPDGQHGERLFRDALALAPHDPIALDVCRWALGRAKTAWGWDSARDGMGRSYWGIKQVYQDLKENPGPHDCLGREFAWLCYLAWSVEPYSRFSRTLEGIVDMACDPVTGVPFLTRQSIHWAEKPDGPFEPGSLKAQTREWVYMYWAMMLRPGLHEHAARLLEYMGTWQYACMDNKDNHTEGRQSQLHLQFGHLGNYPSWENVLSTSENRVADGDGASGINYSHLTNYKDVLI